MSRFYFHLLDTLDTRDEEGVELKDAEAAERHALLCARDLMSDQVLKGHLRLSDRIVVEDEESRIVLQLPFHDAVAIRGAEAPVRPRSA